MTLTLPQMRALCLEITSKIENTSLLGFTEISPRQFVLTLNDHKLLLCLQQPFLRFHLLQRKRYEDDTPWTLSIRSKLEGAVLKKCNLLNDDRILMLTFKKGNTTRYLVAEFFSKKPNLYLLDEKMEIIEALHPSEKMTYSSPQKNSVTHGATEALLTSSEIEKYYEIKEQEAFFLQEKNDLLKKFEGLIKRLQKRKENAEILLQKCLEWSSVHHKAQLLQSQLYRLKKGVSEVSIPDWENDNKECMIQLDPALEPHDMIAALFKQSRKLKGGIPHQELQIEKAENEIQKLSAEKAEIENTLHLSDLKKLQKCYESLFAKKIPVEGNLKRPALPYHEFHTASGLIIWVGKSAKDNDALTFKYAKGSDWWLHVQNFPGSHVILRAAKNQEPDTDSLQDAMLVALYNSKAKDEGGAEICVTQRKYVSSLGQKKKGKVHISKHQVVYIRWDQERWESLKKRLV